MKALVGGMHETQGGAETYHVEVGVALGEESALESGMDATHHGVMTEELHVGVNDNLLQFRVGLHLPGGIAVAAFCLGTGEFEDGLDGGTHIVEVGHHVGALA